jgi:hypothetical protein
MLMTLYSTVSVARNCAVFRSPISTANG